jgi:hypothetical protein
MRVLETYGSVSYGDDADTSDDGEVAAEASRLSARIAELESVNARLMAENAQLGEVASALEARLEGIASWPSADYLRSPELLPEVVRPRKPSEIWIDRINPDRDAPGRDNNSGECARAVDDTWSGHPCAAAALADRDALGERVVRMADWAGITPGQATMAEIGDRLRELGPDSSAVVGCDWKSGAGGHWFNAVNDGGIVMAIDGQSALIERWPPSVSGLGFDESDMLYSDAIFFTPDGKAGTNDHA